MRFTQTICLAACCSWPLSTSACQPDYVQPGFYGLPDASVTLITMDESPSTNAGTGAMAQAGDGVSVGAGGVAGVGAAAGNGAAGSGSAGQAGGAGAAAGITAADGGGPSSACDMTGRWIITHHDVVEAIGAQETIHSWLYYEITQNGDVTTVTKGLHCGDEVIARSDVAANSDEHRAWPSSMEHNPYAGRKGISSMQGNACHVSFEKIYTLSGVTLPYYADPSHALPQLAQQANGSTPGWEDWDNDGHPGITQVVSGLATGSLYIAARAWHTLDATLPSTTGLLKLTDTWNQEEVALGYDGSPLLNMQAARAADTTLAFAEMVRLDASQATGDDAAICAAIRMLAKTLTPNAQQK